MKRRWVKPTVITSSVITGVALCMVGISAIATANNPLFNAMDRVAGRWRGTLNMIDEKGKTIVCTGGIEIVRTGDSYQIVGGFANKQEKAQANFNKGFMFAGGKILSDGVVMKSPDLQKFADNIKSEFTLTSSGGEMCEVAEFRLNKENLTINLSFGPNMNQLRSMGSITVKAVKL